MNRCHQHQRLVMPLFIVFALFFTPFSLMAEESTPALTRTVGNYQLPDVSVIRQDGKKLSLRKELDDGRPVILNFIFTSCSAICPMLSHVFSKVQDKLADVHLVSISIDPENDTPAKLLEYGKKFNAGAHWDYYTGTLKTSIAIQKAFKVDGGDKMNHSSVIFIRPAPDKPWVSLNGFASPDAVIHEYQEMIKP
ncbi:MAG: SCO family protein [Methylococcales bacterium]